MQKIITHGNLLLKSIAWEFIVKITIVFFGKCRSNYQKIIRILGLHIRDHMVCGLTTTLFYISRRSTLMKEDKNKETTT